jgi:hypothetical protein
VSLAQSIRLYNRLLWMLPEDFRRRNGAELVQVFGETIREAKRTRATTIGHWAAATATFVAKRRSDWTFPAEGA